MSNPGDPYTIEDTYPEINFFWQNIEKTNKGKYSRTLNQNNFFLNNFLIKYENDKNKIQCALLPKQKNESDGNGRHNQIGTKQTKMLI